MFFVTTQIKQTVNITFGFFFFLSVSPIYKLLIIQIVENHSLFNIMLYNTFHLPIQLLIFELVSDVVYMENKSSRITGIRKAFYIYI